MNSLCVLVSGVITKYRDVNAIIIHFAALGFFNGSRLIFGWNTKAHNWTYRLTGKYKTRYMY